MRTISPSDLAVITAADAEAAIITLLNDNGAGSETAACTSLSDQAVLAVPVPVTLPADPKTRSLAAITTARLPGHGDSVSLPGWSK